MINPFKENKTINISTSFIEPDSWGCIVEGYYWAAKLLFEQILNSDKYQNRWVIYPILFTIRHYYELSLKDILVNLGNIDNKEYLLTKHNLNNLITQVKEKGKQYYKINKNKLGNRLLVKDFDGLIKKIKNEMDFYIKYDNDSFSFRYPYSKNNDSLISDSIYFNSKIFYESFILCRRLLTRLSTELLCDDNNPIFK